MVALYLVSSAEAAGKTTIAAGVGKRLLSDSKKVGLINRYLVLWGQVLSKRYQTPIPILGYFNST